MVPRERSTELRGRPQLDPYYLRTRASNPPAEHCRPGPGGKANLLLEFFPKRSGEIADIGFGNGVLTQEGCN
jgi:hypothetical protein